ncbi:AlpA family phage regulatory protein [uncultured Endozoicomonas sp.]|uniref:helix-turn-helix transcriptional regulator n=1 Tax=uncultured Endozoicomonas sp. TaxID=432652 RepID=UPI002619E079|nr:AlpA family phage regulatory protein [uncultured Endozoicomonas sp.]
MTTSNTPFIKSKTCPVTAADQTSVVSQSSDASTPLPMPEPQKILPQGVIYLTNQQVRERYQIGNTTLYRWINDEQTNFPKQHQLGPRCVRWRQSDLEAWESQRV